MKWELKGTKRGQITTHRPLSSSFWGILGILNISQKKELLRGLWGNNSSVALQGTRASRSGVALGLQDFGRPSQTL